MKIDGTAIADVLLGNLFTQVAQLIQKNITPTLAVIQVGDDPSSMSYIRQKEKAADRIGAAIILNQQPESTKPEQLNTLIAQYNADPKVHGLIVQRPLPEIMGDMTAILNTVAPGKDVDGFVPNSLFTPPVSRAVLYILEEILRIGKGIPPQESIPQQAIINWLRSKSVVVVGRGSTAGTPITTSIARYGCATSVIHSQTPNPDQVMRTADIIISCVGKRRVISRDQVKPDAILIAVGMWKDENGKYHGDYEEADIANLASFYTPSPGGVGPVNVAFLMQNLADAAKKQSETTP